MAVIWCLEKLHYYLDGSQIEIVTDCTAVKSLLSNKTPSRHMLRWQLAIQEFRGRIQIHHRSGNKQLNAEYLSRFPLPNDELNPAAELKNETKEVFGIHLVDMPDEYYHQIKESYQKFPLLTKLL